MVENILRRIEMLQNTLPGSEAKIAQYILSNVNEVPMLTINELAINANSSRSAVTRLCNSLGVSSFSELKISISIYANYPSPQGFSEVFENEPIEDIKNKIMSNALETIKETMHYLQNNEIHQVVECIEKAQLIIVYGVGASILICEDIAQKWSRLGKKCIFVADRHFAVTLLSTLKEEVLLIVVSYKGETKEVLDFTKLAKQYDIKVVAITQFGTNSISKLADYRLQHITAPESEIRSAATHSLYAQLLTVHILFFTYVSRNYKECITKLNTTREAIKLLNNL